MKRKEGYIALFSTIIITIIFLLIFAGMFLLATGGMNRTSDKENYFQSITLSNICIEETLDNIKKNKNYLLEEETEKIIYYGENYCKIYNMQKPLDEIRIFEVLGVFLNYETIFSVELFVHENEGERTVEIFRWKEKI